MDPLQWFRKHLSLPSNTLGSARTGTPRAVLKAGDYTYLGKAHTALVDTLHMRDVTRKAAYAVLHMDEDGQFNVGGGRFTTAMLYLSEVQSGGTTIFPKLNLAFRPQPGQLLFWHLRRTDGRPDQRSDS